MLLIDNTSLEPYFNIALEEYILHQKKEDYFLVYSNNSSVIVGKHQNAMSEINYHYIKKNNIPVIRRLSGGGTVYHDKGNLNFAFISSGQPEKLSDFIKYTQPIINFLKKEYDLETSFDGRNSLVYNGYKISGNAEHIHKNRIIHHGTLLFSTDLIALNESLKVVPNKYNDKKLKSVRSNVTNISEITATNDTIDIFKNKLINFVSNFYHSETYYNLNHNDIENIEKLVLKKYSKWDWNFAYHADYEFTNNMKLKNGIINIEMTVDNGVIKKVYIIYENHRIKQLENLLINQNHTLENIKEMISKSDFDWQKFNLESDEFINSLF